MWGKKKAEAFEKAVVNDRLNRLEAENIGLEGRVMLDKKTDLDRLLGKYVGLGFEVSVRRESGFLRMECRTSDETLHFWFWSNRGIDGDIEKTLENAPPTPATKEPKKDTPKQKLNRAIRDAIYSYQDEVGGSLSSMIVGNDFDVVIEMRA